TQSATDAPPSGQAGDSITSVAPTRSSPLRKPSAVKTSFVATGTQGLTITVGSFGRFSGNRLSPTPVMSQAAQEGHTSTSAPVAGATSSRRSSSSASPLSFASSRSAAAASAEPPPMPAATGSTFSSEKAPNVRSGTRPANSRAAFSTRLSVVSPQAFARGPVVVSDNSGPGSSVRRSAQSANATTLSRS